jgi:hypothetical protein
MMLSVCQAIQHQTREVSDELERMSKRAATDYYKLSTLPSAGASEENNKKSVRRANTEEGMIAAGANVFGRTECNLIIGKSGAANT